MKSFFLRQLQKILKLLARATLAKYKPRIIGITGTVGKTSTKEAINAVLRGSESVRASKGTLNTELGFPLAILGDWSEADRKIVSHDQPKGTAMSLKFIFWCKVLCLGVSRLLWRVNYPKILILEYGVQRPRDMDYLLSVAKPDIGVLTAIGEIPVHVEFFAGPADVAEEKGKLLRGISPVGYAIGNGDDKSVDDILENCRAHKLTFGFDEDNDVRILNFENVADQGGVGVAFKLQYGGAVVPIKFYGALGKGHAYAAAAAACVALSLGSNLVKIADALSANYTPAKHRMNAIPGIKGSLIIDDTYNASPLAMHAAIETAKSLKALRKIAVLGDMRELGKFMAEAHEEIGRLSAKVFDVLITVGAAGKLIADGALREGGMESKNVASFDAAADAGIALQKLLKPGDLVLIKASRAIGLDKIVEEVRVE